MGDAFKNVIISIGQGVVLTLATVIVISFGLALVTLIHTQNLQSSIESSISTSFILFLYSVIPFGVVGGFLFGMAEKAGKSKRRRRKPVTKKSLPYYAIMLIGGYVLFCIVFFVLT